MSIRVTCDRRLALVLAGALLLALPSWAGSSSESGMCEEAPAPIVVAQANTCRAFNQSCGTAVMQGNAACCGGLWCQNGVCVNFRQANEACGPASAPCAPGLNCSAGLCR